MIVDWNKQSNIALSLGETLEDGLQQVGASAMAEEAVDLHATGISDAWLIHGGQLGVHVLALDYNSAYAKL